MSSNGTIDFQVRLNLPPRKLGPNARGLGHWAVKARATRDYRQDCGYLIKAAWGHRATIEGRVRVDLDFYTYKDRRVMVDDGLYRPRDEQNGIASAKAAVDALSDSGVIKGDTKKFVQMGNVRLHTSMKENEKRTELVLTINSVSGD